jgi:UDP-N-acetylglucosamine--N-acetylmuramyl-(pentapeptide) pyrophosphoryl-undecaprenol N-acetylglucosamine transferase
MLHVLLTGGGSGGHVYPLITVARELRRQQGGANVSIRYVGPKSHMMEQEREDFTAEDIPVHFVSAGKVRRYFDTKNFSDPFRTIWGVIESLYLLVRDMPDVVFAKGGYGSLPVVIAAWIYRIPIMIHESDAVPGVANRIMGKLSTRIAITYTHAGQFFQAHKTVLTGIPVRQKVATGDAQRVRETLHLSTERPLLVVVGGSQGAQVINESIVRILPELLRRIQVVHITGTKNYDDVVHFAAQKGIKAGRRGYHPTKYVDAQTMGDLLSAADIVISRAGASAITEIAAHQKLAILVPLHLSANDHQRMNAYEVAQAGGALVLEESNLGQSMLVSKIFGLLDDAQTRTTMETKIAQFYHPNATQDIVRGMVEMAV